MDMLYHAPHPFNLEIRIPLSVDINGLNLTANRIDKENDIIISINIIKDENNNIKVKRTLENNLMRYTRVILRGDDFEHAPLRHQNIGLYKIQRRNLLTSVTPEVC